MHECFRAVLEQLACFQRAAEMEITVKTLNDTIHTNDCLMSSTERTTVGQKSSDEMVNSTSGPLNYGESRALQLKMQSAAPSCWRAANITHRLQRLQPAQCTSIFYGFLTLFLEAGSLNEPYAQNSSECY